MILITTPTGNIGNKVLRHLAAATQHRLRVIVRDPRKLSPEMRHRVEIIVGSHGDPAVLDLALNGVNAVFWCQPDSTTTDDYQEFYARFAQAGRDAFIRAGTPRIVAISAAGRDFAKDAGPISALHRMEDILRESGAAFRFLRCGSFLENLLWQADSLRDQNEFYYPLPGYLGQPMVATQDIADAAIPWLILNTWTGIEGQSVLGPEDLSYNEIARIMSRDLQRSIRYVEVEPQAYGRNLVKNGFSPSAAQALVDMFQAIEKGHLNQTNERTRYNSTPTTLEYWARQELYPRIEANN